MATIKMPFVLIELNGAEPIWATNSGNVHIEVLDWDEVRANAVSNDELIRLHDKLEARKLAENTRRSIRDTLRERGMSLPAHYNEQ